jgi:hypothetical protein
MMREDRVRLLAAFSNAHEVAKDRWGEDYDVQIEPYRAQVRAAMARLGCGPIETPMRIVEAEKRAGAQVDGLLLVALMAAAVDVNERREPLPVQKHEDPEKVTCKSIRQGEEYQQAVEGGFRRGRAPDDGVLVENSEVTLFVPVTDLEQRMAELGRACVRVEADVEIHSRDPGPDKVRILKEPNGR